MEIAAGTEIAAPPAFVLARLTDFEAHERRAAERGLELERLGPPVGREGPPGVGAAWRMALDAMGARREVVMRLAEMGPEGLRIAAETAGVGGDVRLDLAALDRERTRLDLAGAFAAQGLGGRLALSSLALARGQIERRLADRLGALSGRLGREWAAERASAAG